VSLPCYGSAGDACACVHAESAAPPAAPAAADPLQHGGQPLQPSLQPGHLEAAALCPAATAGCRAAAVQFLAGTALHAAGNDWSPAAAALHPAETAAESGPRHGRLQAALLAGAAADLASVAALQPATGSVYRQAKGRFAQRQDPCAMQGTVCLGPAVDHAPCRRFQIGACLV